MPVRVQIAAMIFLMVQAVLFGVGTVVILSTNLADDAFTLMPAVVIGSTLFSIPISWAIGVWLRNATREPRSTSGQRIAG